MILWPNAAVGLYIFYISYGWMNVALSFCLSLVKIGIMCLETCSLRRVYVRSARRSSPHLFDDDLAVLVDGAVVNHAHDGHAQVTPDTEGDAEAQSAHDGDDVAARQTEAPAVAQRGLLFRGLPGPPILRQLDHIPRFLFPLYHPATARWGQHCLLSMPVKWWDHMWPWCSTNKFLPWWKMRPRFNFIVWANLYKELESAESSYKPAECVWGLTVFFTEHFGQSHQWVSWSSTHMTQKKRTVN